MSVAGERGSDSVTKGRKSERTYPTSDEKQPNAEKIEKQYGIMRKFFCFMLLVSTVLAGVHLYMADTMDSGPYEKALAYLNEHRARFANRKAVAVIDYSKPSYARRMYVIDLETGKVSKYLVAHGKNSGRVYASRFSNLPDSLQSSKGFFVTGESYNGSHGISLVLHGLEKGVNDNARARRIVIHGAEYVSYNSVFLNAGRLGRSHGCPAVPMQAADDIVRKLEGGSLVYVHAQ